MAILELKAARGWSLEQTAKAFHVTAATIASWMNRLDEDGPDALVLYSDNYFSGLATIRIPG